MSVKGMLRQLTKSVWVRRGRRPDVSTQGLEVLLDEAGAEVNVQLYQW